MGFADQVSIVRVDGEARLPASGDVAENGGYVGRRVRMNVESTLWRRTDAARAGSVVPVLVDGWWSKDSKLVPYAELGSRRVEVGDRVLVALVRAPSGQWSLLSSAAALPITADRVEPVEDQAAASPAAVSLAGKRPYEISVLLAHTRPSPAADRARHLNPDERAQAVWAEELEQTGPATRLEP